MTLHTIIVELILDLDFQSVSWTECMDESLYQLKCVEVYYRVSVHHHHSNLSFCGASKEGTDQRRPNSLSFLDFTSQS